MTNHHVYPQSANQLKLLKVGWWNIESKIPYISIILTWANKAILKIFVALNLYGTKFPKFVFIYTCVDIFYGRFKEIIDHVDLYTARNNIIIKAKLKWPNHERIV